MEYETFCEDILEGMRQSKEDMMKDGLWTDETTFEQWAEYAARHVRLTEFETK